MRLTKEEFVKNVDNLCVILNQLNMLCADMDISESVFDKWIDYYSNCIHDLCDIDPKWDENWDGSPLEYWVYGGEGNPTPFRNEETNEEVWFDNTEEVYDYIVKNCQLSVD